MSIIIESTTAITSWNTTISSFKLLINCLKDFKKESSYLEIEKELVDSFKQLTSILKYCFIDFFIDKEKDTIIDCFVDYIKECSKIIDFLEHEKHQELIYKSIIDTFHILKRIKECITCSVFNIHSIKYFILKLDYSINKNEISNETKNEEWIKFFSNEAREILYVKKQLKEHTKINEKTFLCLCLEITEIYLKNFSKY